MRSFVTLYLPRQVAVFPCDRPAGVASRFAFRLRTPRPVLMRFLCSVLCLLPTLLLWGCDSKPAEVESDSQPKAASTVPLRVAIYESEEFARRIETGWQGVSEQPLQATVVGEQELADVAANNDLIVMPARMLGTAVKAGLITSLPEKYLADESLQYQHFLPQLRETQTRWGDSIYGLSLGSPVAMTLVRDDVAEVESDQTLTYEQYGALVETLGGDKPQAAEALADGAAATAFLRRAAAAAVTPWLFEGDSFEPVIDQPPYVRALQQLVDARKHYPEKLLTAEEVWQQIVAGDLKLAIGWPIASVEAGDDASVRIFDAPVAAEVYLGKWHPNDGSIPPRSLLSGSGLVVAISSACRQSSAARNLATWMTTEGHPVLRRVSPHVSVARDELGSIESSGMQSAATGQYDRLAQTSLSSTLAHPPLRIPHADEYLAALNAAVLKALDGSMTAEEALAQTKADWQKISESADVENQKNAWNEARGL